MECSYCRPCRRSVGLCSTNTTVWVVAYAKDFAGTTVVIVSLLVVHLVVRTGLSGSSVLGPAALSFLMLAQSSSTILRIYTVKSYWVRIGKGRRDCSEQCNNCDAVV
jgi:hypothetical protein